MSIETIFIYFICLIGIFVIGKIFIVPLKWLFRLLINSILGGVFLYGLNLIGAYWGLHIGINILTALLVGLLGIPGAILLCIISFL